MFQCLERLMGRMCIRQGGVDIGGEAKGFEL